MSVTPFAPNWPQPPAGSPLSFRDVALLDLARHAAMRAALPLGTIAADTTTLWGALRDEADRLGPGVEPEPALDAIEPFALAWARDRASERRAAMEI